MSTPTSDAYVAILDLYATLNQLADDGEIDAYAMCYTREGSATAGGKLIGRGRAEIADFRRRAVAALKGSIRRHWTTNIRLESIDERSVRGRCYMRAYESKQGLEPRLTHAGEYDDLIEFEDGRWRFAHRVVRFDYVAPLVDDS